MVEVNQYIRVVRVDLTNQLTDVLVAGAGDFLAVQDVSSKTVRATIDIDHKAGGLLLKSRVKIRKEFKAVYLSAIAQPNEWIEFVVGKGSDYSVGSQINPSIEPQAVVKLTHATANTNITPSSKVVDSAIIKASPKNTDIAWIDFGQPAAQDDCLPLMPGDSVSVPIPNLNEINANFEVSGEKVWIIPLL